ncbi:MAG TPA: hydroxyacid dehydrogenase [Acetobacteraceae bacterium]|jgi:D-3-phosphoglycerate dehydrogenase|nr:hydroxyacid dehydrogenase [Acetobacteraceae bacterium]
MAASRWKVVFTDESIRSEAAEHLRATCTVQILRAYPNEAALIEVCHDADAILARLGVVTARVIEAAPRLRIIARHGAGSDAVDLLAATRRGVVVTTTGPANVGAVAEYTFALLLALLRHIPRAEAGMRAGVWSRAPLVGEALERKTLGIVGFGAVGSRVARIATGFGMQVIAAAGRIAAATPKPVPVLPLHEMLPMADVVSLHARLMPATQGIIDAAMIAAMKPGTVLVNTARGELVDEPALIAALQSGHLAGAALDTYAIEPLAANSPLRRLPNVVLSPHVAGQTNDAVIRVGLAAAQAILDELAGRRPDFVVNPEAYVMRESAR